MPLSEKSKLKQVVRSLILAQGNVFIKELLRGKQKAGAQIKIGSTKAEFESNLAKAIDGDQITREDLAEWLALTEGWGAQHVYLYPALPSETSEALRRKIAASPHRKLLTSNESVVFPEELKLTAIVVDEEKLLLTWHRGSAWFSRAQAKDETRDEGLDHYELRAYLEHRDRAVVRFEWRFDRPFCGLFVQLAYNDPAHDIVFSEVWDVLLAIGAARVRAPPMPLVRAVRKLGTLDGSVERGTKWWADGGYGTLLFARLLVDARFKDLRFGRVILAGSIVAPNYDWAQHVTSGRIEQVVNHCGDRDAVVRSAQYFIPHSGPSGRCGFIDKTVHNVRAEGYGHGTFFDTEQMRTNLAPGGVWDRFLTYPPDSLANDDAMIAGPAKWSPGKVAVFVRFALKLLAVAGLGLLIWLFMQFLSALRALVQAK
jgi:hypothetical protein